MPSNKEAFLEMLANYQGILHNEESVIGLLVAAPIGLFVSYYSAGKIRSYQLQQLDFLKDLYRRLNGND